ncbi:MAG: dTDP-4-dehydrorhamnose 3,5-epimerase [Deltaproteobacteria bacterium]|nr:dTDP-4-dehydrorhamnose 3,5-epimerase [Deltaproteobacteria bacterium]
MNFSCIDTSISDLKIVEPKVYGDARGFFKETYSGRDFAELGIQEIFVQDNHSRSLRGTLRGLHFQRQHPQAKLVRVLAGKVFDVAVDLRAGSPTYGKWHGVELDAEGHRMFFIPAGFAHGFLALSDSVELAYKCSAYYHPEDEAGLIYDDPQIGIRWPLEKGQKPLLSDKDAVLPTLEKLGFRIGEEKA